MDFRVPVASLTDLCNMILSATLVRVGVKVRQIRSSHTQAERDGVQREFQDRKTNDECLVASMALSAFGVNYHAECSHGIVLHVGGFVSTNIRRHITVTGRDVKLGSPTGRVEKKAVRQTSLPENATRR
ncbi:hypothetical protein J3F83DRAFT_334377 [Trichoderma novae-zelandiae]